MSAVYLLSSLPGLSLGQPPKLTAEAFLSACASHFPPERLETLRALLENRPIPGADGYAARWFDCDTQIRNAIARRRAAAKGVDPSASIRPAKGCNLWLDRAVENAFALKNPLAREEALDALRFKAADELAGVDPLDPDRLFAYAVRLGILLRRAARNPDAGRQRLLQLADVPLPL